MLLVGIVAVSGCKEERMYEVKTIEMMAGEKLVSFCYTDITNIGGILDYIGEQER